MTDHLQLIHSGLFAGQAYLHFVSVLLSRCFTNHKCQP